ncbi:MAG TPA: F0F1 ATP synthase subunit gamma [Thauera aminoaromatica]|jgi:F-type H+-transporting ATPase subunit gamma|nr:F0F1 ATP synthase subunit gamma [Thauera aminoaromatica]
MPSLKSFRVRIASVKSTRKITKAMQMVAAAKLRRAQAAAEAARPYAQRMERVLSNLGASMKDNPGAPKLLAGTGRDDVHLVIVATGDRGLAGGFNSNIVKLARQHIGKLLAAGKQVKILAVGRKGRDQLRRDYARLIVDTIELGGVKQVGFGLAQSIAGRVLDMYEAGEFDVATLFYSHFKSVISQVPTEQRLIPAEVAASAAAPKLDLGGAIYAYEPDETEILADLLPRNVAVQVFRALLENAASFFGAQMSAMDNATRNAGEVIDKLTIQYNRSRQAMITKELIEIISGAEAL